MLACVPAHHRANKNTGKKLETLAGKLHANKLDGEIAHTRAEETRKDLEVLFGDDSVEVIDRVVQSIVAQAQDSDLSNKAKEEVINTARHVLSASGFKQSPTHIAGAAIALVAKALLAYSEQFNVSVLLLC